jgi:hypothetical protein
MTDDFSANIDTTGVYTALGTFRLGLNEDRDDTDWFRVAFFERHYTYDITISGNTFDGNTRKQHGRLDVHNSTGGLIKAFNTGSTVFGLPSTKTYTHNGSAGDNFLSISGGAGGYRIHVDHYDVGDTKADADELDVQFSESVSGAIETNGDIDFYEYKLIGGVDYTIDLVGVSSTTERGTTLSQPVLDLHDHSGLRAVGVAFGEGSNKRITFTPDSTGFYQIRVRANGGNTGSYVLESDQFDDFEGTVDTEGVLPVGGRVEGVGNYRFDSDWFKVELVPGFSYLFNSTNAISVFNSIGERVNTNSGATQVFSVPADSNSTHFVGVRADDEYFITVDPTDDYSPGDAGNYSKGNVFDSTVGAIESIGDRDRFIASLYAWGAYTFNPRGFGPSALANPRLAIFNANNNFVSSSSTPFAFNVPATSLRAQKFSVDMFSADGTKTGVYDLGFKVGDHAAGDDSTKWNVDLRTGSGRIRNALETSTDVDWHRIKMKAGVSYEVKPLTGLTHFSIVRPNGTVARYTANATRYFRPAEDGDHYLVADAADVGFVSNPTRSFQYTITEGAIRQPASGSISTDGIRTTLRQVSQLSTYANVEVIADTELQYLDGGAFVQLPAGELKTFSLTQFNSLTLVNDAEMGEVFVRGLSPTGNPDPDSPWASVAVYPIPYPEDIAKDDSVFVPQTISYAFAETLPSYLVGDPNFSGFESLSSAERSTMNTVISRWNSSSFSRQFATISGSGEAATMIFKAAINSDVLAFQYGDDVGGDIIINTNSPLMSDLTEGKQGFFEMLRAVGIVKGLNQVTTRSRDETVMGDRASGELMFASYPTPLDIRAARNRTEKSVHQFDPDIQFSSLNESAPFLRTLIGNNIEISAAGQTRRVNIDLRPGKASYVGVSQADSPQTYVNSFFSRPVDAIGGDFSDALYGNESANILRGGRGNDILVGGAGDDMLHGGANNDYYIIKPGHGNNTIDEESAGGRDTIRYEGLHNMTGTADDLTLQRLGNDLIIRLEYDGQLNKNTDTITIKNMSDPTSRIESLAMFNNGAFVERINLISAFNAADESRGRFQLAPSADTFGRLVTPV